MTMDDPAVLPPFVSRSEAEALFAGMAAVSTSKIGITREAYGPGEQAALELIRAFAVKYGLETSLDRAANLCITLPGQDRSLPVIVCGSHLDSVPEGGNYDGAAGIVAGILCLARMKSEGFVPPQDLMVLALRCEESAWFGKAYIGSSALFGELSAQDLEARHRDGGKCLLEALVSVGADIDAISQGEFLVDPAKIGAYLELHIEQGPVMVARGLATTIVTGIRGAIRHRQVRCLGQAGHSGAVPRWLRKDAFFATAELINALDEHWQILLERGLDLVVTAGIVATDSRVHAMTRIPDELVFSLEIRSQSVDALEAFYHLMRTECKNIERSRGVHFEFDRKLFTPPARLSEAWIERLKRVSAQLHYPEETLPSGAGHDAAVFANNGIPTAMIFIRNADGSHNPDEKMAMDDFLAGVELLYQTLKEPL